MGSDPSFTVHGDPSRSETLVCGVSEYGLAGLTAANYLVEQLGLSAAGHVTADGLPAITPFEDGTPRRHTRLFTRPDAEVTVLVGDLLVPAGAARAFGEATVEWAAGADCEEVVVLSGVPVAHGPDDHRAFFIASEGYQRRREPRAADVRPMSGGFLDGVNGAVTTAGLDAALDTCVYTTPVHAQAPDVEAALRLLTALDAAHGLGLDTGPLEGFAAEVSRYYAELSDRLAAAEPAERSPEDRMYM
jgi:uncharacterized protein